MPGPQVQQQMLAAPPSMPQVDPAVLAAAYSRARDEQARVMAGFASDKKFLDLKPSNGAKDWNVAPRGSERQCRVFLAPNKTPGALPFQEDFTHFWKGAMKPQGDSVPCLGVECPVCVGRELVNRNATDDQYKKHVRSVAKVRRQVVYQVLSLDTPNDHVHQDGQLRPLLVRLSLEAHTDIGQKLGMKGAHTFFDPQNARPIVITKTKKGDSNLDVETKIDDLDLMPVDPWFWNVLANLHDLSEIVREADAQKYARACQEMGLPMQAPELQQALNAIASAPPPPGQSYSPSGHAPNVSPYGAAQQYPQPPMQQYQQPPAPAPQGYYGAPQGGYAPQGAQVPPNVPPGLAGGITGRG